MSASDSIGMQHEADAQRDQSRLPGLHLMGDFQGCECGTDYLMRRDTLREHCRALVEGANLAIVGDHFHQFGGGGGVTGVIVLAESHLAIHTWPETMSVSLDVYVCNYGSDNRDKARRLFDALLFTFAPREPRVCAIDRV
jgi:S-adenosylmethionine decarboxylase